MNWRIFDDAFYSCIVKSMGDGKGVSTPKIWTGYKLAKLLTENQVHEEGHIHRKPDC